MATLSISIVTYFSDEKWFKSTCASLFAAIAHARAHAGIADCTISLIDNSDDSSDREVLYPGVTTTAAEIAIISGQGNIGYGAAHNLALMKSSADFHLVLNPDITMKRDALTQALAIFTSRADAACVTPSAVDENGEFTSLCKRRVTPIILLLRAGAPGWLKSRCQKTLNRYEYRGELRDTPLRVVTASGAFMLVKTSTAQKIAGFDERFFLHFEDVDFSLRLHRQGEIIYAPQVKVVHAGGGAAGKHLKFMLVNGWRYFRKWGLGDPLLKLKATRAR